MSRRTTLARLPKVRRLRPAWRSFILGEALKIPGSVVYYKREYYARIIKEKSLCMCFTKHNCIDGVLCEYVEMYAHVCETCR
jgi:hypothetical protein